MSLSYRWTYGPHDILHIQDTTWNVYYNRLVPDPVCIQSRWYRTIAQTENVYKVEHLHIVLKVIPLTTPFTGEPTIPSHVHCVVRPRECCLIRDQSTQYLFYVRVYTSWSGDLYTLQLRYWTFENVRTVVHFYLTSLLQLYEQKIVHTNITLQNTLYHIGNGGVLDFCLTEPSHRLYIATTSWTRPSHGTFGYLRESRGYHTIPNYKDDQYAVSICLQYLLKHCPPTTKSHNPMGWNTFHDIVRILQSIEEQSTGTMLVDLLNVLHTL